MNVCARVESNGAANRIHLSSDTANLLKLAGKENWIVPREEMIHAKGKGLLSTYWLEMGRDPGTSISGSSSFLEELDDIRDDVSEAFSDMDGVDKMNRIANDPNQIKLDRKRERLIDWHVDIILGLLREITVRREALDKHDPNRILPNNEAELRELETFNPALAGETVLSEVKEIVSLPRFNATVEKTQRDPTTVELPPQVEQQVRDYVRTIAALYKSSNPFHNFEHASHVAMSTVKLLSRIISPVVDINQEDEALGKNIHDHTFGVTSDPVSRFACVFSALIHDVSVSKLGLTILCTTTISHAAAIHAILRLSITG